MTLVQSTAMQLTTGTYRVSCPALQQEQLCHSMDEANDVCFSMHQESDSYAFVEDYLGHGVIEYGVSDTVQEIADLLFD
jgi:hypothetical protein